MVSGRSRRMDSMPTSAQSLCLPPTYHLLPGSSPTSTVPRPGTTPLALSAETRSVSSLLICAAVALPSSTRDVGGVEYRFISPLLVARVEREVVGQFLHAGPQRGNIRAALERGGDDVGDLGEFGGAEAAGGQRRGTDPQAGGDHRRTRVERHGVAVDRDACLVQQVLGLLAVQVGV